MNKINILPTFKYFLVCTFAWSMQYLFPNGLIWLIGFFLLAFTTLNFVILVLVLQEISGALLDVPVDLGLTLSTNQEILLYQAFNLLIIFSLTNDYFAVKRDKIILIRRSIPLFAIGVFFLYSNFVNYIIHADKHANNARDDVQLLHSHALKVQEYITHNGKIPTNKELYCEPNIRCANKIINDYGRIVINNNGYKLEVPRVRFLGKNMPFYRGSIYYITYDSNTNTTSYDYRTDRKWWILYFMFRAVFILAFMFFPFTLELIKSLLLTIIKSYKVYVLRH